MSNIKFSPVSTLWLSVMSMAFGAFITLGVIGGVELALYCQGNGHGLPRVTMAFIYGFLTWPFWLFGG